MFIKRKSQVNEVAILLLGFGENVADSRLSKAKCYA